MHFFVPQWVRHGRNNTLNAIYSVDVQPNASRVATAGQDHKVRLWSLPVIAQHARPVAEGQTVASASKPPLPSMESRVNGAKLPNIADNTEKAPDGALLAVLEAHTGAVNCVRWAPTGDLLASGGDDHLVLVYERDVTSAPTAFAAAAGAVESWRVWRPFRGHSMDVAHVCWSPDGERMASASVDNLVIVWNVRGVAPLARLEGHSGFVKGVAWDPVGKFLASQSDDRSVRVWRTSDWKVEKVIDEPFATAVFEENAQAFFLRLDWSPCGSHLLAVNAHKQPAVHCAPMFARESGFVDQIEFVGHLEPVVCARFSPRLYRSKGKPEMNPYTVLLLGSKDSGASCWQATGVLPFFRMADMFDAEVLDLSWGSDGYTIVACSSDGQVFYLRFAPEELGDVVSREETNEILKKTWRQFGGTFANGSAPPEYPAQLRATNAAVTAAENEPAAPVAKSTTPAVVVSPSATPTPVVLAAKIPDRAPPADPRVLAAQNETRVGGKRRITPIAVTPVNGTGTTDIAAVEIQEQTPAKRSRMSMLPAASNTVGFGGGAYEQRLTGNAAVRPAGARDVLNAAPLSTSSVVGLSLMLLPGPNESVGRCRFISNETPPTLLEAKEETSAAGGHSVTCSKGGKTLWKDYHPKGGAIVALAGIDKKFVAAAAEDGVLFLYSASSGRRIAPPIVIDSAPHLMEAFSMRGDKNTVDNLPAANGLRPTGNGADERWFLLIVSRAALCSVFDVRTKKLMCARSAAPLLARAEGDGTQAKVCRYIVLARVTPYGEPILSLSDRHTFAYSRQMCAWARVADNSAPNSEFSRTLPGSSGLLRSLGHGGGALLGMGDITRAATESLAHLESLLEAAIVLGAADDYRYYLSCYATRVAAAVKDDVHQCEERLRELCDTLIGAEKPEVDPIVIGMSGRALLKDTVLPVVTASRELQRVAEEYAESLTEIEKSVNEKKQNGMGNSSGEGERDGAESST